MLTTNELLHKKGENIRGMFASIAARYDFLNSLLSCRFDRRWRRFAVGVSGLQEGDKVLDVCTGTGDLAIEYAKAVAPRPRHSEAQPRGRRDETLRFTQGDKNGCQGDNSGYRENNGSYADNGECHSEAELKNLVVGTDFCAEMLRLAIPKIMGRGTACRAPTGRIDTKNTYRGDQSGYGGEYCNTSLRFVEADTLHLPFADGSFQVSSVAFGIRNVADLKMGIREMARVISPGGRVVILEFAEPENRVFRMVYDFYFHNILPVIGRFVSTIGRAEVPVCHDAYAYLPGSVEAFPNRWQLKAVMESCGLEDVMIYPRTFGIVNVHVGKKPASFA